jgi:hypothetical protein
VFSVSLLVALAAVAPRATGRFSHIERSNFAPEEDCAAFAIRPINNAEREILVGPNAKSGTEPLAAAGVPVWIDAQARIAHAKTMVIDGAVTLMGSMNWTRGALRCTPKTSTSSRHRLSRRYTRPIGANALPSPRRSIGARTGAGSDRRCSGHGCGAFSGGWPTISTISGRSRRCASSTG